MLRAAWNFRFALTTTLAVRMICTVLAAAWTILNSGMTIEARERAAPVPSFNSDIAPILQKNCLACHSSAAKMGGLVMESYDALIKGGAHGQPIVPGNADG